MFDIHSVGDRAFFEDLFPTMPQVLQQSARA
jgi:hypothetical protein